MEKYIGIPYVFNGRDERGLDCYGLVRLVEKEVFHKELPLLADLDENDRTGALAENRPLIPAEQVDNPVDGDIVLLFLHDVPQHIGVYWNRGVLHATNKSGVVWEKLNSKYMCRFNKKEFYRV